LEIRFEVFLQIFVHFGNKEVGEIKTEEKRKKKTLRCKTITACQAVKKYRAVKL